MKKDVRNRRSASSCSNYSQHSMSMVNLDSSQAPHKQVKEKKIEFSQIEKQYLQVYSQIKSYAISETSLPQKSILYKWKQCLKLAIQQIRQYFKNININMTSLKNNISQIQNSKNEEIRQIKASQQQQIKLKQNEISKRLMDISAQFTKKEQQYKDVISKFIDALHKSQNNWSKIYTQMAARIKKADELLRRRFDIDNKNQQAYQQMMCNWQSNNGQHVLNDQSIGSINLSHEELGVYIPTRLQSRRNTIDISSIEEINQCEQVPANQTEFSLQQILIQLLNWNFFGQKNNQNIQKLISLTKSLQNPQQIINEPIFPILIQSIKWNINLSTGQTDANNSNVDNQQYDENVNSHLEMDYNGNHGYPHNRIIMRDIENQIG